MLIARDTIVLVVDGARMLLLRNEGDAIHPTFRVVEHRQVDSLPGSALMADAPGMVFQSGSPHTSTYDEGNAHTAAETRFIEAACAALDRLAKETEGAIVVAAPPTALGVLRRCYTHPVRARLKCELDRDYTRLPVPRIAQRLDALEIP